jgi:tetratricopeptide (TPR) repeat protein
LIDILRMMVSIPTAPGELPRLYELDPLRFQEMCRDLYQVEVEFATAEVFGVSGQGQRGIDILAIRRDGAGTGVGQCKCVEPISFTPALIKSAADEFSKYEEYWRNCNARRYVLFVASDATHTKIQEEYLRQIDHFRNIGIQFELWSAAVITNKLRSQPGITRTYLGEAWEKILCGTGITGFPRESPVINDILRVQLETLAAHVAHSAKADLESLRDSLRRGHRKQVLEGIGRLHESSRWQTFPSELRAAILRLEAQLALPKDIPLAKKLADEASQLDPEGNLRIQALLARAEGRLDMALEIVPKSTEIENVTLRATLLMERGQVLEAMNALQAAEGDAEGYRLRAVGYVLQKDLLRARLEIEKAAELKPLWLAIQQTRMFVYYLSAISPAAIKAGIPEWPEPVDWKFVKTDDESRGFLRLSADTAAQIEMESELNEDERRVYETWHVACLANDPERREEATSYSQTVLSRDPENYRITVWVLARRLDVNVDSSIELLQQMRTNGTASLGHVLTLLVWYLEKKEYQTARELAQSSKSLFLTSGEHDLWQFWNLQIRAAAGERPDPDSSTGALSLPTVETILLQARAAAQATKNWIPLIEEFRKESDRGNRQATFELCSLFAFLRRWNDAEPLVSIMVDSVATAEAVRLACVILYNAGRFDVCLNILETHRSHFPHSELPSDMLELRIQSERHLGLLPIAAATAEDAFRKQPSKRNFLILADVYFEKGDLASLAIHLRKHAQFEELTSTELLGLGIRAAGQDRSIAADLWKRALQVGVADQEVTLALDLGYKLGLDRELRSLAQRMQTLAASGNFGVRSMHFEEARDLLLSRLDEVGRTYELYLEGAIPVHLAAFNVNRPLSYWYHRSLLLNSAADQPVAGITFLRHGWRTGLSVNIQTKPTIRLHADLTAILAAAHFGFLSHVESTFSPIVLPHHALIALTALRDSTKPHQPARRDPLEKIEDLLKRGSIEIIESTGTNPAADLLIFGDQKARQLDQLRRNRWLCVDFLPMTDDKGNTVPVVSADVESLLRTPHSVVEALWAAGEITGEQHSRALESMGPEHATPSAREIERGVDILCSVGALEQLASAGVLDQAARTFKIHLSKDQQQRFVDDALIGFRTAEEDGDWITTLIAHITSGIDQGKYLLLPRAPNESKEFRIFEQSLEWSCFLELLTFTPKEGDTIWIEDRHLNAFVHRDGPPIIDTVDLLHILSDRKVLTSDEFYGYMHRLRESDVHWLALNAQEITHVVTQAEVQDGSLSETRELRTLRRHYMRALAKGDLLAVAPVGQQKTLEWPFLLDSGNALTESLAELWSAAEGFHTIHSRAEWILQSLYIPDRGRSLTKAERTPSLDHQLEAVVLAGSLLSGFRLIGHNETKRQASRDYLSWIYARLVKPRFESDTALRITTLARLRDLLLQSFSNFPDTQIRRLIVGLFLEAMPDELSSMLAEDGEFMAKLSIPTNTFFRVGEHRLNAEEFWCAAVRAFKLEQPQNLEVEKGQLVVRVLIESDKSQLVIEDKKEDTIYVPLHSGAAILSDSISERERALQELAEDFDLPLPLREQAVARIAQLNNAEARVLEVDRVRRDSAQYLYSELARKISGRQLVDDSELLPNAEAIARHLRLAVAPNGETPFATQLEEAATGLISDVGVKESIVRLASIPVALPAAIMTYLKSMPPADRGSVLKSLIRPLTVSPLGAAHLCRLLANFTEDKPSYNRYVRWRIRKIITTADQLRPSAWLTLLQYVAEELQHQQSFRAMPTETRLCLVWAHADRLFRILVLSWVDENFIAEHFRKHSGKLRTQVTHGEEAFTSDVTHPARMTTVQFAVISIAYASGRGPCLDDDLKTVIEEFLLAEPSRLMPFFQDLSLAPDSLGSIMCENGQAGWLAAFTQPLREGLSVPALRAQLNQALDNLRSGSNPMEGWATLNAILADHRIPAEYTIPMGEVLLGLDFVALQRQDHRIPWLAALLSARQARHFGSDAVEHIRSQLIALADTLAQGKTPSQQAGEMLLSAAFELYNASGPTRLSEIARIFEDLISHWPVLAEKSEPFISNLVEGLPNTDSRVFWPLYVKIRAIR